MKSIRFVTDVSSFRHKFVLSRCFSLNHIFTQQSKSDLKKQEEHSNDKLQNVNKKLPKENLPDSNFMPFVDLSANQGVTVKHVKKETANSALLRQCLEKEPNKDGFVKAVDVYIGKNRTRRGHIDFISTAMKFIEPYKLDNDIEVYNKLLDVFPKDKFNNRTLFDAIWPKTHPQMFLALDILTKMEWKGVLPTEETHDILHQVFGSSSLPLQKVYRMWFWFEEFKDINPYKLPAEVYKDRVDIVKAAVDRILGNNDGTKVVEISSPVEENELTNYEHFVVSSQTPLQQKYIEMCSVDKPLYVEGPVHIWINHKLEYYFILKTGKKELVSFEEITIDDDEEREGVILGVCFATKPYEETLQRWIDHLQLDNPTLRYFQIIFNINESENNVEDIQAIASS